MYYMHDVPKYARMHERMEFCAHCMVNILQNVSQKRESKKITKTDIGNAMECAYLTLYPGNTLRAKSTNAHVFGHFPLGFIYLVKGEDNGNASVVWGIHFLDHGTSPYVAAQSSTHAYSLVKVLKNVLPASIYPQLKIQPGEKKILLDCAYCYHNDSSWKFTDGRNCANVSPREAFGFFVLSPSRINDGFFNKVVIFTPKPGLFDETLP
jgi:hypothetical protein